MSSLPVLVIGFNRSDKITAVLDRLVELNFETVYIALDGPRNQNEISKCAEVLNIVRGYANQKGFYILFRDYNLGCCLGVISAIDWFFQQEDFGIILEDDCLPSRDFFVLAEEFFINRSKDEDSAEIITAHNPFDVIFHENLSKYPLIHGWATCAEVWKKIRSNYFRVDLPRRTNLAGVRRPIPETIYWWVNSTRAKLGLVDTWDGIFVEKAFQLNFKCLIPNENMVQNLGYGPDATHTIDGSQNNLASLPKDYKFNISVDEALTKYYFKISKRHLVTPLVHLIFDSLKIRKRKKFEKILNSDAFLRKIEKY